jgi:hypothetical protein
MIRHVYILCALLLIGFTPAAEAQQVRRVAFESAHFDAAPLGNNVQLPECKLDVGSAVMLYGSVGAFLGFMVIVEWVVGARAAR